jgi:hypothetical protein
MGWVLRIGKCEPREPFEERRTALKTTWVSTSEPRQSAGTCDRMVAERRPALHFMSVNVGLTRIDLGTDCSITSK